MDELGPVSPRTFPPAPGWSAIERRIQAPLEYSRGPDEVWVYGALRVREGQALSPTGPARNTVGYRGLVDPIVAASPPIGVLLPITTATQPITRPVAGPEDLVRVWVLEAGRT